MFRKQIELYNYPTTYRASAEPRESWVRVVCEDTSTSFMDILKDSASVAKEISWDDYNRRGPSGVERAAQDLAEELFFNQLRNLKKLSSLVK